MHLKPAELDQIINVALMREATPESIEGRVALAEDHRKIGDLVMLYGWLCDRRRWDDLLEYYTDDFERTLAGTLAEKVKGKDKMRELYVRPVLPRAGNAEGPPPVEQFSTYEIRHMIHPPVIRVSTDKHTATAAAVYSLVVTNGDGRELRRGEHEGAYIFGMRREPDLGWRFQSMVVISENARNPMFQRS